jgi:hypothetical protein
MMLAAAPPATASPSGPDLRDIHLPPDPAWWPPAPGWWMLAALVVLALLVGAWQWRRYRRMLRQRRHVLLELEQLAQRHRQDGDAEALASGLHQLLRRVARRHEALATRQRGDAWRRTLARMPIDTATLDVLLDLDRQIYHPHVSFDHAAAIKAVRQWLRWALKSATWKRTARMRADA